MSALEDLPKLPREQWPVDESPVWQSAERMVMMGYRFTCESACSLNRTELTAGWMNNKTGLTASELGAPVHQALFVAVMRGRR